MTDVAVRDLRNDTAGVLRRVESGEEIIITVHGRAVARVIPADTERRWMPAAEVRVMLDADRADAGLRDELRELVGQMTDELDATP